MCTTTASRSKIPQSDVSAEGWGRSVDLVLVLLDVLTDLINGDSFYPTTRLCFAGCQAAYICPVLHVFARSAVAQPQLGSI